MPERYLGRVLGRYRVDAFVGTGGFAWVYRGFDPDLEIAVALKVLKPQFGADPEFEARFRREAATAAKLRHPNIVTIYAVGREDDAVYFAMDLLAQGLAARLDITPTLPEPVLTRLGADVARALAFAHRAGVVHRDVKIDNILFDEHGNGIVVDFGIARAASEAARETRTNVVVGTPQYFAPEQARGRPVDGRTDIYALGVTLFRAATGQLPFEGEDWYVIARQHVEDAPPSLRSLNPALSPGFEAVVLRCMAKDPDDRFATGDELADALNQCAGRVVGAADAPTMAVPALDLPDPARRGRRGSVTGRGRGAMIAGGAVAVMTVAGLMIASQGATGTISTDIDARSADTLPPLVVSPPTTDTLGEGDDAVGVANARATLSVTAPGAQIALDGRTVGTDRWSSDQLAPARYRITAQVPNAIDGCPTARVEQRVTVGAGASRTVSLDARPCGRILFYRAPTGTRYQLIAQGSERRVYDGLVQMSGPIVVPAGRYDVTLNRPGCRAYEDVVEIVPATSAVPEQRSSALPLCEG